MNNKIITATILLLLLVLVFFFIRNSNMATVEKQQDNIKQETNVNTMNEIQQDGSFAVIADESKIIWTAGKPNILGYTHEGTMALSDGAFRVEEEVIEGELNIDMTKLRVTSLGGGKAGNESRLESHLKTGDFFNVEEYPESNFTIVNVNKESDGTYSITGNLKMKDITNEITFPASISVTENELLFNAEFSIDRTKWGITFGSASFFDNLAENAVGDEVSLSLELKAVKE